MGGGVVNERDSAFALWLSGFAIGVDFNFRPAGLVIGGDIASAAEDVGDELFVGGLRNSLYEDSVRHFYLTTAAAASIASESTSTSAEAAASSSIYNFNC